MSEHSASKALAEAVAALAKAERANIAKSRFLAAASHDLRQPLQALRLLNATLQEYLLTDDIALNILQDSESALEVMDRLLGSLLDISKIDSGVIVPDLRHFRISDLFEGLKTEFLHLAREKNLHFTVVPSHQVICTDRMMLESILRNFLANAVRYTARGKILLGCRKAGNSIRIQIHDTGIGIPNDHQDRIFDEFYQMGNPDRDSHQGLGLGLAIVRGYGRLLGHPVQVRSREGVGSVFTVEVPLGNAADAVEARRDRETAAVSWSLQGARVLVIEDDDQALEALHKLLDAWGMQVTGVRSGAQAAENLTRQPFKPDIIISDYRLAQGETGIDALAKIAPLTEKETPVIFITGDAIEDVRAALGNRYPHLLRKPVAPAKLRALIRNLRKQPPG